MAKSTEKAKENQEHGRLDFHYQKSPDYRTVHCDGAFGGITTRGYLSVTLYNERNTLPRRMSRPILETSGDGAYRLGEERIEDDLGGIMRQLETTVILDLAAAQELYTWIGKKVADMEEASDIPEDKKVAKKKD